MRFSKIRFTLLMALLPLSVFAQDYENVTLLDNWTDLNLQTINEGIRFNEVWGFVHEGQEYGVIGSTMGTHIFLITENDQFEEIDFVPGAFQGQVIHRHFDDFNGYLYGVCDQGTSTLQIMDLQYLPDSVSLVYNSDEFVIRAHNCFIDRSSDILYLAGPAGNALRLLSISNPTQPEFIRNFDEVNYVHDLFVRNDTAYLNAANQGLMVVDFSDPINAVQLGSLGNYVEQGYNHSGWLSADGNTYVFADETGGMRMKVCDVSDLSDIEVLSLFNSGVNETTVPHNLQMKGDLVYVSHYNDGLQVFDISNPFVPARVAYYDTFYGNEDYLFNGAWGVYAFLPSGRILISDRTNGLFLFRVDVSVGTHEITEQPATNIYPNPCLNEVNLLCSKSLKMINIYNLSGQLVLQQNTDLLSAGSVVNLNISSLPSSVYVVETIFEDVTERSNLIKF
jgi:choice-of-anchor B domain-containing protein